MKLVSNFRKVIIYQLQLNTPYKSFPRREGTASPTSPPVPLSGAIPGGHTSFHVLYGGTLAAVKYRNDFFNPYAKPYAGTTGEEFTLMDDNARSYRDRLIEEYLEDQGLERMDLNPIEYLSNSFGRQVAASSIPPRSINELEQPLLYE
ncbi:hypothetical protein AVEN_183576-1 [Araneus ventricosus]|uniref:Uncharacterized protein n=1 Tax=Araneus ventricosus TaxID=182803 RepID=A0A4Y2H1X1_ARAVE|nr:hypothetical protein AVEN_183576-1 [Araneus ventricosus]